MTAETTSRAPARTRFPAAASPQPLKAGFSERGILGRNDGYDYHDAHAQRFSDRRNRLCGQTEHPGKGLALHLLVGPKACQEIEEPHHAA